MQFYRNLSHIRISRIVVLLFSLSVMLSAQTAVNQQLNLAKMLETTGNYDAALQFYLKSYRKGDVSYQTISGIKKCYVSLGKFDELIAFFEEFLRRHPGQVYYKVDLGSAYYQNNQKEKAVAVWQDVLRQNRQNPTVYRRVASAMTELRLYDDAIAVYQQALRHIQKQEMLHRDIAQLYRAQLNYGKATDHFIRYYTYYPKQMSYVRMQLIAMARDTSATDEIIRSLLGFVEERPDDYLIKEVLGDMYIRAKNFDRAFAVYETLPKKKEKESYLQRFAREAEANHAYDYAVKAYRLLIKSAQNPVKKESWSVLLARNLYQSGKNKTGEDAAACMQQAVDLLTRLENTSSSASVRRKALELHARVLQNDYQDYDGAIALYQKILEQSGRQFSHENDRIRLLLAEMYILKNDLAAARAVYEAVKDKNYARTAAYRLAELCYYRGDFQCAKAGFNELLARLSPKDTLTNNVLDKVVFLEQFSGDSSALARYGKAELLYRQKKYAAAAQLWEELTREPGALRQKAGLQAARLYMRLNQLPKAEAVLTALLEAGLPENELDEVYFLLARVKDKENDITAALDHYRTVFVRFPNSLHSEDARERARTLTAKMQGTE